MTRLTSLLIAAPIAVGLLAAPAAHAEWRGHGGGWGHGGGYGGGGYGGGYRHHGGNGGGVAAGLLGLGAAAIIGGIIATQHPYYAPQPQVVYAPQPYGYYQPAPVYAAPVYAQPPAYYYAQPGGG